MNFNLQVSIKIYSIILFTMIVTTLLSGLEKSDLTTKVDVIAKVEMVNATNVSTYTGSVPAGEVLSAKKPEPELKPELKPEPKHLNEILMLIIAGEYGSGDEMRERLTSEGYDYNIVEKELEELEIAEINRLEKEKQVKINSEVEAEKVKMANNVKREVQKQGAQRERPYRVVQAYPHTTFKSYMRWTALSKTSPQGKLSAKATKDPGTAIMVYEGRYLVALGYAYAEYIGQKIDIVMENGNIIPATVGDYKAIVDTDENNSTTLHDGSIIEFIVSSNADASKVVNKRGNYNAFFPGQVKEFRILE